MKKEQYRLHNTLFDSLIFISIKVGKEEVLAMFDTGASISIISQSLAKKFNCLPNETLTAGNNNGKSFTLECGYIDRIEVCGLPITNVKVGILPNDSFDFGVDDAGKTFPAQMLLGWDTISKLYWRIDTKNQLYYVSECGYKKINNLSYYNFPTIKLKYKTDCALFGFDTGHTETLHDQTWRSKLDNLQPVDDELRGVGGSSVEQSYIGYNFELIFENEEFCLEKVTVLQHPIYGLKNTSSAGLLGIDFFKDSVFEIDYSNKYFHIKKMND